MKGQGSQYKRHYDATVHDEQEFVPIELVFVDKLPVTGKTNTVDEIARASYNKLQLQKGKPFQIIEVQLHTVMRDKEGTLNAVSIHRFRAIPGLREHCSKIAQTPRSPNNKSLTMQKDPGK